MSVSQATIESTAKAVQQLLDSIKPMKSEPWKPDCRVCNDSYFITENRDGLMWVVGHCDCRSNARKEQRRLRLDDVFGEHAVSEYNKAQKAVHSKFVASSKTSLWLTGRGGLGKSAYVHRVLSNYDGRVYAVHGTKIENVFREQTSVGNYLKKDFNAEQYGVIAIDDIDKAKLTDAVKRDLYELLEMITRKKVNLMVTGNLSIGDFCDLWPEHVAEPLERRLRTKCECISIDAGEQGEL